MLKGSEVVKEAFNPESAAGELKRIKKAAPPIPFKKYATDPKPSGADAVAFLAMYLKSVRIPAVTLTIEAIGTDAKVNTKRADAVKAREEHRNRIRR